VEQYRIKELKQQVDIYKDTIQTDVQMRLNKINKVISSLEEELDCIGKMLSGEEIMDLNLKDLTEHHRQKTFETYYEAMKSAEKKTANEECTGGTTESNTGSKNLLGAEKCPFHLVQYGLDTDNNKKRKGDVPDQTEQPSAKKKKIVTEGTIKNPIRSKGHCFVLLENIPNGVMKYFEVRT
jgi:hypothetical protein